MSFGLWLGFLVAACTGGADPAQSTVTPPVDAPVASPAPVAEGWTIEAQKMRFVAEDGTLFVQAALHPGPAARTEPVHVGVTVITVDGQEVDLMVQTLFPGNFDAPVLFSAGLEAVPRQVLIGAWDQKIEPCDVDRPGCKAFGFVLDRSLASWPPGLYSGGGRQRIIDGTVSVSLSGGSEGVQRLMGQLEPALQPALAPFGAKLAVRVAEGDTGPAEVVYRNVDDAVLVSSLVAAVSAAGFPAPVTRHEAAQAEELRVRLP